MELIILFSPFAELYTDYVVKPSCLLSVKGIYLWLNGRCSFVHAIFDCLDGDLSLEVLESSFLVIHRFRHPTQSSNQVQELYCNHLLLDQSPQYYHSSILYWNKHLHYLDQSILLFKSLIWPPYILKYAQMIFLYYEGRVCSLGQTE